MGRSLQYLLQLGFIDIYVTALEKLINLISKIFKIDLWDDSRLLQNYHCFTEFSLEINLWEVRRQT